MYDYDILLCEKEYNVYDVFNCIDKKVIGEIKIINKISKINEHYLKNINIVKLLNKTYIIYKNSFYLYLNIYEFDGKNIKQIIKEDEQYNDFNIRENKIELSKYNKNIKVDSVQYM